MPKLSALTRRLKEYAVNPTISDEEFLNAFLFPLVMAGNIKNKNHEEFHLNKTRTSEIMNQKADIPVALRNALSIYGIKEETRNGMETFVGDYLNPHCLVKLSEILSNLMQAEGISLATFGETLAAQDILPDILTELLMESVSESNVCESEVVLLWKHGNNSIDVHSGDLFHYGFDNRRKKKNIVVIPVNTAFDTHVTRKLEGDDYPLVSENTIHGQWLIRLTEAGENAELVDARISESLKRNGFSPVRDSGMGNGKKICYPIGSVAIIEIGNAFYFLVAIAEFDKFNNARSSSGDIDAAISSLMDVYDRFGMGYDLYLPLMGTGLSRAGLSTQEAYDLITENLKKNKYKIQGHIHLIIRPDDRCEIKLRKEG